MCPTVIDEEIDTLLMSPVVVPPVARKRQRPTSVSYGDSG